MLGHVKFRLAWTLAAISGQSKLQALVYDILPLTTAVFSYAIGSRKLSDNEQFEEGAGKRCSECVASHHTALAAPSCDEVAVLLLLCCFTSTEARWLIRDGPVSVDVKQHFNRADTEKPL